MIYQRGKLDASITWPNRRRIKKGTLTTTKKVDIRTFLQLNAKGHQEGSSIASTPSREDQGPEAKKRKLMENVVSVEFGGEVINDEVNGGMEIARKLNAGKIDGGPTEKNGGDGEKTEKNVDGEKTEKNVDGEKTEKNVDGKKTEKNVEGEKTEKNVDGKKTEKNGNGEKTEKNGDGEKNEKSDRKRENCKQHFL